MTNPSADFTARQYAVRLQRIIKELSRRRMQISHWHPQWFLLRDLRAFVLKNYYRKGAKDAKEYRAIAN
jgi:hypothetical protein